MAMAHPSKRRRTSALQLHIGDLPDSLLTSVASYLAKPSRPMFAAAMTMTSGDGMSMPILLGYNDASSSGNAREGQNVEQQGMEREWGVLDFRDVDKDLAAKLTDDDLRDVLTCIHAGGYLKTLRLAGCINITGCGLEPLRSSAVLEHMDLSLGMPYLDAPPDTDPARVVALELEEDAIMPILDSIVRAHGCSLKLVVFHRKLEMSRSDAMNNFLDRYEQLLESRNPQCTMCTEICRGFIDRLYQKQNYTCNQCFQNYCNDYRCERTREHNGYGNCSSCDRELCHGCRYTACSQGGSSCRGCWTMLGQPRRNRTSYFLYSGAIRNDVKAAHPDARFGDIAIITSRQFIALPAEERAYWDEKAAEDKRRYQRDIALYREVFPEA